MFPFFRYILVHALSSTDKLRAFEAYTNSEMISHVIHEIIWLLI